MSDQTIKRSKVAILLHNDGSYASLAFAITDSGNFVNNFVERAHPHLFGQAFNTPDLAEKAFDDSLATSRDRGWSIIYNGQRNWGG